MSFHDAEPLLHPEWRSMVEAFTKRGFFVSMTTSGVGLREAAGDLAASGLHHLEVSVDAGDEETYRAARGKGSLTEVEEGIRSLSALGEPYPRVTLNAVISGFNAGKLSALGDLAGKVGVRVLTLTHSFRVTEAQARRHNAAFPDRPVTASRGSGPAFDAASTVEEIVALRRSHPGLVVAVSPELSPEDARRYGETEDPIPGYGLCRIAGSGLQVLPNGDVTVNLACFAPAFGNVRSEPLSRIWSSEPLKAFRRTLMGSTPPACLRCGGLYCG